MFSVQEEGAGRRAGAAVGTRRLHVERRQDPGSTSTAAGGRPGQLRLQHRRGHPRRLGDTFWDVVKKGAEQAGKDEGVKVSYQSDGDPAKQSQLIDAAVNQKVDGLVVSMANPDALKASIEKAVAAGIPVITINSGQDKFGRVRRHRPRRSGRDDRR